jgi:hypothetical protein
MCMLKVMLVVVVVQIPVGQVQIPMIVDNLQPPGRIKRFIFLELD